MGMVRQVRSTNGISSCSRKSRNAAAHRRPRRQSSGPQPACAPPASGPDATTTRSHPPSPPPDRGPFNRSAGRPVPLALRRRETHASPTFATTAIRRDRSNEGRAPQRPVKLVPFRNQKRAPGMFCSHAFKFRMAHFQRPQLGLHLSFR